MLKLIYSLLHMNIIYSETSYDWFIFQVLAWQALCRLQGSNWQETPVTFSDVILHQATVLSSSSGSSSSTTTLVVRILPTKGEFEVRLLNVLICCVIVLQPMSVITLICYIVLQPDLIRLNIFTSIQVVVSGSVAASGRIHMGVEDSAEGKTLLHFLKESKASDHEKRLQQQDVYKELRLRGYQYGGIFQGILHADIKGEFYTFLFAIYS